MDTLNNDLLELLKSHISIFDDLCKKNNNKFISQVDFIAFWVDPEKFSKNSPFDFDDLRDNPGFIPTDYPNIYKFVEEDKIILQYVDWEHSPIAILQWYKMKVKVSRDESIEKWKISVYGKWLKLYYSWYIDWLADYIDMYYWETIRADLCFDSRDRVPEGVIDLWNTVTYWEWEKWTYKWFWNKRSPLFIRIYDKTLDLKKDKNCMAWLYPSFYTDQCWRLEFKFTWRYAQSMNALQWLWVVPRDWQVQKKKEDKRNFLRSAFYNLLMYIDYLPSKEEQYKLLSGIKDMCVKKMNKLKDYIQFED